MNIFAVSKDPVECAQALDDKRLRKMVLETAQILSTVAVLHDCKVTYNPTHINHPCTKWACQTQENFRWLLTYYDMLCVEYRIRFNKTHACEKLKQELWNCILRVFPPDTGLTPFPNCTTNKAKGISFKHIEDVHEAYKLYLNARWKTDKLTPKWTNREKPSWANYENN